MKTKYLIYLLCCLPLVWSCSENEIPLFKSDDAGIYFNLISSDSPVIGSKYYSDTVRASFTSFSEIVTDYTMHTDIRIMGKIRNFDRPVKISIDSEKTTAVEGYHFELGFSLNHLVVPAGEASVRIYVKFLRTPDLKEGAVKLVLKLEDNEHFKCYIQEYKNINSYYSTLYMMLSGTRFTFIIDEIYSMPQFWGLAAGISNFGQWTVEKYLVVNRICGLTNDDWQTENIALGSPVQAGRFPVFASLTQKYLQGMADAGAPVLEADGSYMQLGVNYPVDYSAYE